VTPPSLSTSPSSSAAYFSRLSVGDTHATPIHLSLKSMRYPLSVPWFVGAAPYTVSLSLCDRLRPIGIEIV
jgi:hypothetical protein